MLESQVRAALDESRYHCLRFRSNGRSPDNPYTQDSATVDLRIFAQSKDESALSTKSFFRPIIATIMQSDPGATFAVDTRQAVPKSYYEYWVALLPQSSVKHVCHIPFKGLQISIAPPSDTQEFIYEQESYNPVDPIDLSTLNATIKAPLGYIAHARSGDKGSDCNVGFFVRNADEWDWLRSLLTVEKVRELLGGDDTGKPIFRFELPNIWGKLSACEISKMVVNFYRSRSLPLQRPP